MDSAREKQRDNQSGRVPYTVSVPLGSFQLVLGAIVEGVERRKASHGIINNRTERHPWSEWHSECDEPQSMQRGVWNLLIMMCETDRGYYSDSEQTSGSASLRRGVGRQAANCTVRNRLCVSAKGTPASRMVSRSVERRVQRHVGEALPMSCNLCVRLIEDSQIMNKPLAQHKGGVGRLAAHRHRS